jgi:hypothetical protein
MHRGLLSRPAGGSCSLLCACPSCWSLFWTELQQDTGLNTIRHRMSGLSACTHLDMACLCVRVEGVPHRLAVFGLHYALAAFADSIPGPNPD